MTKTYRRSTRRPQANEQTATHDTNLGAAGLLYDMAALQPTPRSQFGYKRAATAIVYLPMPVSDYAIAHARLAGISADRVINCWSDDRLEEWMRSRHGKPKKARGKR